MPPEAPTQDAANDQSQPNGQQQPPQGPDADPQALSRELERWKTRARQFEGKVADYEVKLQQFNGIDLEEYKRTKEEREQLEEELRKKNPTKEIEHWKSKADSARQEYQGKLEQYEKTLAEKDKVIKGYAVTDKVLGEIGSLFNDDAKKFIKREIEERCDLEDGEIIVKDERGEVMYSRVNRALPMGVKEFGDLLVEQYPSLAKPAYTGGAKDATPGQKVSGRVLKKPSNWAEFQAMNPAQKQQVYEAMRQNPDEFKAFARQIKLA